MGPYSLPSILRRIDRPLLIQFLKRWPDAEPILSALETDDDVVVALDQWNHVPDDVRHEIDAGLRRVHDLSTEAGLKCVHQEIASRAAIGRPASLPEDFASLACHEDQIMCALLHDWRLIDVATLFQGADTMNARSWCRFTDLPAVPDLHLTSVMGTQIENGLRERYSKEGRGARVTAERYRRGRLHYVFVFVDDYGTIRIEHQENTLRRMAARPTFEVVFLYDPDAGTLEVFVPGDRKAKTATARLFAAVVLGIDSLLASNRAPYNLDILQSRATSLTVRRADGVALARVRRMRLALRPDQKQRLTFEVPHEGGAQDIHALIDDELRRPVSSARYQVTQAEIQLFMVPDEGTGRQVRHSFTLTAPNNSSVRNLPDDIQAIAIKYLKTWGVDVS